MNLDSVRIEPVQPVRGRTAGAPTSQDAPFAPFAQALSGATAQPEPDRPPTPAESARGGQDEPSEGNRTSETSTETPPAQDRPLKAPGHHRHAPGGQAHGHGASASKAPQSTQGVPADAADPSHEPVTSSAKDSGIPAQTSVARTDSQTEELVPPPVALTQLPASDTPGDVHLAADCAPPGLAEQLANAGTRAEAASLDDTTLPHPGDTATDGLQPAPGSRHNATPDQASRRTAASAVAEQSGLPQPASNTRTEAGSGSERAATHATHERSSDRMSESLSPAPNLFAGGLRALISGADAPNAAAPTPHFPVTIPVTDPRFGHAFGERISWMVKQGLQTAELTLNPPDLGPIRVALSLEGDSAHFGFQATHVETRAAIEQALPRLRELLSEQGLKMGDAAVGSHADQQARSGDQRGPSTSPSGRSSTGIKTSDAREDEADRIQPMRHRGIGRIDLFA